MGNGRLCSGGIREVAVVWRHCYEFINECPELSFFELEIIFYYEDSFSCFGCLLCACELDPAPFGTDTKLPSLNTIPNCF